MTRRDKSDRPVPAPRLVRIIAIVCGATLAFLILEISTWFVQGEAALWFIRVSRVLFALFLASLLSLTILKKERTFHSSLLSEAKERDLAEQRMRLAMETSKIGYWDWDVLKNEPVWSDTCKSLLGLPAGSHETLDMFINRVHPDEREKVRDAIQRAIEEKQDYACEFRVLWPDGSTHWRSARGRAFYDEARGTERMIGVVTDIDDQKATGERLRLQVAALEAAANAIVITNSTGSILWVNQAFTDLTGYKREESIGQNPRLLKSGEHEPSFYAELWSTIQSGQVWRGEVRNRKKDGSRYTEEMTITPVRSPGGEITHFIAIKQDVTEKKQLEAQYRQAQKMEAVGRLAGGVAHDFNNVLGVIIGYSDISLEQLAMDHPVAQNVQRIRSAADRAASLVKQLLAFSRQQIVHPKTIDLNSVVQNMQDMLQRLVGDDVSIVVIPTRPLDNIRADEGQLEQVLMNLAVNARDAMPGGGRITIETRNVEADESYQREHQPVRPGPYVMLSVADTGCGMDAATKARIFEPFFTTKEAGKGTGLGLSTVYGIMKQNGGYVWVYSEPDKGTIFRLYFPRTSGVARAVSPPARVSAPAGGSETILLVEDDDDVREFIALTLRAAGYSVLETSSAASALEAAARHPENLHMLLADVLMPQTSGVELIKLLRATAPNLRVVLMSGYAADMLTQHFSIPDDVGFIEKPFTRSRLLSKIRTVLDGPGTGEG